MVVPKFKLRGRRRHHRRHHAAKQHKQRGWWSWQNQGERLRNMPPLELTDEEKDAYDLP